MNGWFLKASFGLTSNTMYGCAFLSVFPLVKQNTNQIVITVSFLSVEGMLTLSCCTVMLKLDTGFESDVLLAIRTDWLGGKWGHYIEMWYNHFVCEKLPGSLWVTNDESNQQFKQFFPLRSTDTAWKLRAEDNTLCCKYSRVYY